MRVVQPEGNKGSLKWIQRAVANPAILDDAVRDTVALPADSLIDWKSPVAADGWAEYRDAAFLQALGLDHLAADLKAFWPRRGPQWDALGRTSTGEVLLVEAKSHPNEMRSTCKASPASRGQIVAAFDLAKRGFGADPGADWTSPYYQYANRLSHLFFLRRGGVPAHLVFMYFLNDVDMAGAGTQAAWLPVIREAHASLGLSNGLPEGAHEVFVDVQVIAS